MISDQDRSVLYTPGPVAGGRCAETGTSTGKEIHPDQLRLRGEAEIRWSGEPMRRDSGRVNTGPRPTTRGVVLGRSDEDSRGAVVDDLAAARISDGRLLVRPVGIMDTACRVAVVPAAGTRGRDCRGGFSGGPCCWRGVCCRSCCWGEGLLLSMIEDRGFPTCMAGASNPSAFMAGSAFMVFGSSSRAGRAGGARAGGPGAGRRMNAGARTNGGERGRRNGAPCMIDYTLERERHDQTYTTPVGGNKS